MLWLGFGMKLASRPSLTSRRHFLAEQGNAGCFCVCALVSSGTHWKCVALGLEDVVEASSVRQVSLVPSLGNKLGGSVEEGPPATLGLRGTTLTSKSRPLYPQLPA